MASMAGCVPSRSFIHQNDVTMSNVTIQWSNMCVWSVLEGPRRQLGTGKLCVESPTCLNMDVEAAAGVWHKPINHREKWWTTRPTDHQKHSASVSPHQTNGCSGERANAPPRSCVNTISMGHVICLLQSALGQASWAEWEAMAEHVATDMDAAPRLRAYHRVSPCACLRKLNVIGQIHLLTCHTWNHLEPPL